MTKDGKKKQKGNMLKKTEVKSKTKNSCGCGCLPPVKKTK
jgi:hypothetical protein